MALGHGLELDELGQPEAAGGAEGLAVGAQQGGADAVAGLPQAGLAALVLGDQGRDGVVELVVGDQVLVGLRGDGEARGHADALGDQLYILCGTILSHGMQHVIEEVFMEIQSSNMSKLGADGQPIYREDGKVMKGPNYFRPNIAAILESVEA